LQHHATFLQLLSRVLDAAPLFEESLAIYRKELPADHPELTLAINNLGSNLFWQRRYAEAAKLHEEALQSRQRALPLDERTVADSLHNLADAYRYLGRPAADVIALYQRALEIRRRLLPPDDPAIGQSLQNLASVHELLGDMHDAEQNLRMALAVYRRSAHPDAQVIGGALNRLGIVAFQNGDLKKAETQFRAAIRQLKSPGALPSMALAAALDDLAVNQMEQQRLDDARTLLGEALAVRRQILPPTHGTIARTLSNLSEVAWRQRRFAEALETSRQATEIVVALDRIDDASRFRLQRHIRAAWSAMPARASPVSQELNDEAFVLAQRAVSADIGQVISRMSARLAAANAELRALLRSGEELQRERELLELQLPHSFSLPPSEQAKAFAETRSRLAGLDRRRAAIEAKVRQAYPEYFRLVAPSPLTRREVQELLRPDEVLVAVYVSFDAVYAWTITNTAARWTRARIGVPDLAAAVGRLRGGLDRAGAAGRAAESLGTPQARGFLPFDLGLAHDLYTALLGDVGDLIGNKRLLIVPSGPLTSLPFHVLVTRRPDQPIPDRVDAYAGAAWLARRHALTVLPSVTSLAALRRLAPATRAPEPYIGFGNPLVTGPLGTDRRAWAVGTCATTGPPLQVAAIPSAANAGVPRGVSAFFRGRVGDVAVVRKLAPLPETAGELCDVARSLGGADDAVHVGAGATEAAVKALSAQGKLAGARVVHFATHGLVAGELHGLAEPALVLSPPLRVRVAQCWSRTTAC
jgi:tetratricopeptide (TPR) repeat protein